MPTLAVTYAWTSGGILENSSTDYIWKNIIGGTKCGVDLIYN